MSSRHPSRFLVAIAFAGLLLLPAARTTPALVVAPPEGASPEVIELAELSGWIHGADGRFELFASGSPSLQKEDRSFALFRGFDGSAARRQVLATLPYGDAIQEAAEQYRLDSLLLAAIVQAESGFDAEAVSPQGASGLMQLMPATAASYGASPGDPRANVRAGARYLSELLRRYDDDLALALAAYNAGPTNVARYGGVPPFRETNEYIRRVLTLYVGLHGSLDDAGPDPQVSAALLPSAVAPPERGF